MFQKRKMEYAAYTGRGLVRQNNEDNFLVEHVYKEQDAIEFRRVGVLAKNKNIVAVADGMGGEAAGEVASYLTVSRLEKVIEQEEDLTKAIRALNNEILTYATENELEGMGSTLALLLQKEEKIVLLNVGDSRIYRYLDGKLEEKSKDHTKAEFMVEIGMLTEEEARKSPSWHVLTQNLGLPEEEALLVPHQVEEEYVENARYLLCSDGLTDMVSQQEIEEIFRQEEKCENIVKKLTQKALEHGGKDNITVLAIHLK